MGMVARRPAQSASAGVAQGGGDGLSDPLLRSALGSKASGDDGQLYGDLLERAAVKVGATDALFSLTGTASSDDDGRNHYPEDDQTAPLPSLVEKHAALGYERYEDNPVAVKGAGDSHAFDAHDVAQGALGDCYLIASMAAVARSNPESVKKLIKDNGNGTYDVTLYIRESQYGAPKKVVKTIDARLPSKELNKLLYAKGTDTKDGKAELWPSLIEKAVAQQTGSYEQISGGNIGKNIKFAGAMELLTGKQESYIPTSKLTGDDALLEIGVALESKKPVTVDSKDMAGDASLAAEAEKLNVYGNHAYAPEKVDLDNGTMDLQNPWGSSHVKALKSDLFIKYYRAIRIGG